MTRDPVKTEPAAPAPDPSATLAALSDADRQHWQKTGELPEGTPGTEPIEGAAEPKKPAAAKADEPAKAAADTEPSDDDIVNDPEAIAGKPRTSWKARLRQAILRERAAATERDTLKTRVQEFERTPPKAEERREPAKAAEPAAVTKPEPKFEDFINEADPLTAYHRALAKYEAEQLWETKEKDRAERVRTEQAVREIQGVVSAAHERGRTKYGKDAWDARMSAPEVQALPPMPVATELIFRTSNSEDVLYYLSEHTAEARALAALDPVAAALEVGRLSALARHDADPVAAPSKPAKREATTLGTRPAAPADESEAALARGDFAAYARIENEKEMRQAAR